jgi:hypothetical protein
MSPTGVVRVDTLTRALVQADKLVEQESACSVIVVASRVLWKVVLHGRYRQLGLEEIDLVQEKDLQSATATDPNSQLKCERTNASCRCCRTESKLLPYD